MLTEEEKRFIEYWEQNRNRKKRLVWQLAAGLPLALLLVGTIFFSIYTGWYTRASNLLRTYSGSFMVILAMLGTIVFLVVFTGRHKWEMNEQRYRELMAKK